MDLGISMSQGTWKAKVDLAIANNAEQHLNAGGLVNGARHKDIIKNHLLMALSDSMQSVFTAGDKAHFRAGSEIDDVVDAMVQNAGKDGVDLDGDFIQKLLEMSGTIHAVHVKWQEVKKCLNEK